MKPNGYNMCIGGNYAPNTYVETSVKQYDLNFNLVKIYKSVAEASRSTGIYQSDISKCCLEINKSAGGYFWCFKDTEINKNLSLKNKKVYQYSLDGVLLAEFSSLTDASNKTSADVANISSCCRNKAQSAGGFLWSFKKDKDIKYKSNGLRSIIKYDLNNNIIKIYPSIKAASDETGIGSSAICACCKCRNRTGGGFIWKYYSEQKEAL